MGTPTPGELRRAGDFAKFHLPSRSTILWMPQACLNCEITHLYVGIVGPTRRYWPLNLYKGAQPLTHVPQLPQPRHRSAWGPDSV